MMRFFGSERKEAPETKDAKSVPPVLNGVVNTVDATALDLAKAVRGRFSHDKIVIQSDDDKTLIVNVLTSEVIPLPIRYNDIYDVFFLPDGRMLYQEMRTTSEEHIVVNNKIYHPDLDVSYNTQFDTETVVMLTPSQFACRNSKKNSLCVYDVSKINKPVIQFPLPESFYCCSIAPLGENHIVVGGSQGEILVFQKQKNTLVRVDEITAEVAVLRDKIKYKELFDRMTVKTIGNQRDILIVIGAGLKGGGFVGRWQWQNGKLKKQVHAFHNLKEFNFNFCELRKSKQFLIINEARGLTVWDEQLQSGVVKHDMNLIRDVSLLSDGRFLFTSLFSKPMIGKFGPLMSEKEKFELYQERIKDAVPVFDGDRPYSKMIAGYVCG